MSKTSKNKKGKLFRENANKPAVPKGRNWTEKETEAFCYVLADGEFDFALTLETKALKKQANKEVFEGILSQLKISQKLFHCKNPSIANLIKTRNKRTKQQQFNLTRLDFDLTSPKPDLTNR